ncbi:MAG: amidohydrolase family protein, partial [Candidatus Limnocylindrales bacterium]
GRLGALTVVSAGGRVTVAGTDTLAGSLLTLDAAVRNVVASGRTLPDAVAAASRNPLAMLGITDRGRISPGQRADLVELDGKLRVRRVMRGGRWLQTKAG